MLYNSSSIPVNASPNQKAIHMKSSVRIIAAAAFVAALGIAPLISVAQETPAAGTATATSSESTSTSVAADGTTTTATEATSTSTAADGTVTATTESSSSESSSTSSAGQ